MSYRELRNFVEMLRALGYPRLVSIENFRIPNFKLVAEILSWLLKRYDPDNDIPVQTDTEQDRIIFIKTATLFMVQKARIKVNPKKLYQADGYAVQEMLKIATVLYGATQENQSQTDEEEENMNLSQLTNDINAKLNELRISRQLASEITDKGANLSDLLGKEVDLREQRSLALARPLELNDVEKHLKSSIKAVEDEIKQTLHNLDNIVSDEASLDAKIEKKKADLERQQKRFAQLQTVRPAYMDEYDKLENELQHMYSLYVQKYRNLCYLEHVQADYDKVELERNNEADIKLRNMAEKMREEEKARFAAAEKFDIGKENEFSGGEETQKPAAGTNGPKYYGNMTGAGLSDEDDEGDSMLSDEGDDDDDEDEVIVGAGGGGKPSQPQGGGRNRPPQQSQHMGKPSATDDLSDLSDDPIASKPAPPAPARTASARRPGTASNNKAGHAPPPVAAVESDDDF